MTIEEKIDIELFKVVTRAIAQSDQLDIMADHLTQLLAGALETKACSIFAFNPVTGELERLSSFGFSLEYLNKGPVLSEQSLGDTLEGRPTVIPDITQTDHLQYPEEAKKEGIASIVSLPIMFRGRPIGALRVYGSEVWEISPRDLDSLLLFAENVGLAMAYTMLANAVQCINEGMAVVAPLFGDSEDLP